MTQILHLPTSLLTKHAQYIKTNVCVDNYCVHDYLI